jgi:hypothetical protein
MKTTRLVSLFALAALLPLLGFAKSVQTYAVVAYYHEGAKPAQELVDQAAREVGTKMAGLAQTTDAESADHSVEILFKAGSYKIYVDALPLAPKLSEREMHIVDANNRFRSDQLRDTANSAGSAPAPVHVK